jgi:hypothetical protein
MSGSQRNEAINLVYQTISVLANGDVLGMLVHFAKNSFSKTILRKSSKFSLQTIALPLP